MLFTTENKTEIKPASWIHVLQLRRLGIVWMQGTCPCFVTVRHTLCIACQAETKTTQTTQVSISTDPSVNRKPPWNPSHASNKATLELSND